MHTKKRYVSWFQTGDVLLVHTKRGGTIASPIFRQKTVIVCLENIIRPSQRTSQCRNSAISPLVAKTYLAVSYVARFFMLNRPYNLHLEFDSEGRLRTKHYENWDDFNIPIVNFQFMRSTIPAAHVYGVYISQMIRYSRACGSYEDFLDRGCC